MQGNARVMHGRGARRRARRVGGTSAVVYAHAMHPARLLPVIALLLASNACVTPRTVAVAADATGEQTRITGLAKVNGYLEQAPPGATEDALLDEFEIVSRSAASTCVRFTTRTQQQFDLPPSE